MEQHKRTLDEELGLMSEEEYCAFRGLDLVSARNERYRGKSPDYVKMGNTVKYKRASVKEFAERRLVRPSAKPKAPTLVDGMPRKRGRPPKARSQQSPTADV